MFDYGISFLITKAKFECSEPFEIIPDHCFRRATPNEILEIDRLIDPYVKIPTISSHRKPPFSASSIPPYKIHKTGNGSIQKLEENKWHYWVVEFKKTNASLPDINNACILCDPELDFGPAILYKESKVFGFFHPSIYAIHKLGEIIFNIDNVINISTELLESISTRFHDIKTVGKRYPFISDALTRYRQSRSLVQGSNLKIVGYFSVIELLITHSPRLNESLDSITHQLVNKMILLSKQYQTPICPKTLFGEMSTKKLWKKLYSFRSAIAHGGSTKFSEPEFKSLSGINKVEEFLRENIKQLILLALKEPEFLIDLKKC